MYILISVLVLTNFVMLMYVIYKLISNYILVFKNIRDGVGLFRDMYGNPFNIIFRKKFLNEKGVDHQKKTWFWFVVFCILTLSLFELMGKI